MSSVSGTYQPPAGTRFVDRRYVGTGEKVSNSLSGACFGIALFLVAFPLLFWNESRAVVTHTTLMEALDNVNSVASTLVDPKNNGKLIHITGALNRELLKDFDLGVSVKTVYLSRNVEMYQWREHVDKKTVKDHHGNDVEETTTSYDREWSSTLIDSHKFRDTSYHNPSHLPIKDQIFKSNPITAGSFRLSKEAEELISLDGTLSLNSNNVKDCRAPVGSSCFPRGDYLYFTSGASDIGDVRVQYKYYTHEFVSVIGQQKDDLIKEWKSPKTKKPLLLLNGGELDESEMIDIAVSENNFATWALRGVGLFLMFIGLTIAVEPILQIIRLIPFFGGFLAALLGIGTTIAIFIFSLSLTFITISIGWFWARPLLSVTLLAIGLAPIFIARAQNLGKAKVDK